MIRKYLLLTLVYFIPIAYLHIIFPGIEIQNTFWFLIIMCAIFAFIIIVIKPIMDFLTVKDNIVTKILIAYLFSIAILYILSASFSIISIQSTRVSIPQIPSVPISTVFEFQVNTIETLLVSSLLLAIWGIIATLLIS